MIECNSKGGDDVYEWIYAVQKLVDWVDENAIYNPTLIDIANHIGYSPYYCSMQFHRIAGMTIKNYMAKRRLGVAALALRDTDMKIVDIAMEYGFSSQSALTRAFLDAFGITPAAYRKKPVPIPLQCKKIVVSPLHYIDKGDLTMSNLVLPSHHVEYIPAHKLLGVYKRSITKDGEIWPAHDCDLLCGIVSSFRGEDLHRVLPHHTSGWTWESGKRTYFYGAGVETDYKGAIPEGFELRGEFPGSYYIVFRHPPFDYLSENYEVVTRVLDMAWNFDPKTIGFEWNEDVCQDYERHSPEGLGYQVLRPVRKI